MKQINKIVLYLNTKKKRARVLLALSKCDKYIGYLQSRFSLIFHRLLKLLCIHCASFVSYKMI
jgi:phage gp36-like protein